MNLIRKLARGTAMVRDNKGEIVPPPQLARDNEFCKEFITDTVEFLNDLVDANKRILVEGTQGSQLSMHFGPWPKTTSRETNASSWLTEMGLSPHTVNKVYMVCRTFPIRVAGNSGPMADEVTWEFVTKFAYNLDQGMSTEDLNKWLETNNKKMFKEITSATKRIRRCGKFSISDMKRAIAINRPDEIMLTFVDYLNADDYAKITWDGLSQKSKDWIGNLEEWIHMKINFLSTGPDTSHTIIG
jgi:adenylosuccinate synthase